MRERGDTGVLAPFKWMLPGEESHRDEVVFVHCGEYGLWIVDCGLVWMADCALLTIDVGGSWRFVWQVLRKK